MSAKIPPAFTTEQRIFVFSLLAEDVKNAEVIAKFKERYPYYCDPFPEDVLKKNLSERLRTYRSKNKDEIALYKEQSFPSELLVSDPKYLLGYLQKLLLTTPEVEVVAEGVDSLGNPYTKRKSNRPDICKMISLILSITGFGEAGVSSGVSKPSLSKTDVVTDMSSGHGDPALQGSGGSDVAS